MHGRKIKAALAAAAFAVSCGGSPQPIPIVLPPTSVVSLKSSWAVITSPHLRLRQGPTTESQAVTTLWKGYVLEIVSKTTVKSTVEDREDFWFKIRYGGLEGWVFGSYLEMFETRETAESFSEELR